MSQGEQKQVDVLLAAYAQAKGEIGRRSALSWTAVGGYLAFILAAFAGVLDKSDWRAGAWAVSTWPVACLAYQFYVRELQEIHRLSEIIRIEIEERLRQLLQVHGHPLLLERADPRGVWKQTGSSQRVSEWAIFLGGPTAVTVLAVGILLIRCVPIALHCFVYLMIALGAAVVGACAVILSQWLHRHCQW